MADLQGYTSLLTYVDGAKQVETTTTSFSVNGNHVDVMTEAKGFAGQSLGAPMVEGSLEGVIPAAGWEKEFSESVIKNTPGEVTVFVGGLTLTVACYFGQLEVKKDVNGNATFTVNFKGPGVFLA